MNQLSQRPVGNALLSLLNADDFELIRPHLKRVSHSSGDVIAAPGAPLDYARFPEGAVTALLTVMRDGARLAVGLIGYEGLIGCPLLHGARQWQHEVVVRAAQSTALRIDCDRLLDACRQSPSLHHLLLRYSGNFVSQVGRTSVSNLVEPLERRMARWILLYHDRLDGDDVPITHAELGIMLGVRRASITDMLHVLEGRHAISGMRGHIVVRDRARVEEIAGETYGDVERDYAALIGPFGKSPAPPQQEARVASSG